ncbi:hypothetical protein T03_7300 [Trichinella britovi]|uniref:Uncharacterized protein n=1 Tax=Trichinella britovi TaxID=45882 RepID=A0A0V1D9N4_TRIBR|nr:hypothetical protein T03_7300 [Trichinella britovi]
MCVKLSQVVSTTATANVLYFLHCFDYYLREAVLTTFVYNNIARNQKIRKRDYRTEPVGWFIVVAARTGAAMQLITDRSICDTQHLECGVHRQVSLESTEDEYTDYKEGKYEQSVRHRDWSVH